MYRDTYTHMLTNPESGLIKYLNFKLKGWNGGAQALYLQHFFRAHTDYYNKMENETRKSIFEKSSSICVPYMFEL